VSLTSVGLLSTQRSPQFDSSYPNPVGDYYCHDAAKKNGFQVLRPNALQAVMQQSKDECK